MMALKSLVPIAGLAIALIVFSFDQRSKGKKAAAFSCQGILNCQKALDTAKGSYCANKVNMTVS